MAGRVGTCCSVWWSTVCRGELPSLCFSAVSFPFLIVMDMGGGSFFFFLWCHFKQYNFCLLFCHIFLLQQIINLLQELHNILYYSYIILYCLFPVDGLRGIPSNTAVIPTYSVSCCFKDTRLHAPTRTINLSQRWCTMSWWKSLENFPL